MECEGGTLTESDLDICSECGHLRGLHVDLGSLQACTALDEVTVERDACECDSFKEEESS